MILLLVFIGASTTLGLILHTNAATSDLSLPDAPDASFADEHQWPKYTNEAMNYSIRYPGDWKISRTEENMQGIRGIGEGIIKARSDESVPLSTVTFSPMDYSYAECKNKALSDCPGFEGRASAVVTMHVYYAPQDVSMIMVQENHNPFIYEHERTLCAFNQDISITKSGFGHVLHFCVQINPRMVLAKHEKDAIIKDFYDRYIVMFRTFQYLGSM